MTPPTVDHRFGAYSVHPQDYDLFAKCNFDLTVTKALPDQPPADNIVYLDAFPSGVVQDYVAGMGYKKNTQPVTFPVEDQDRLLSRIEKRATANASGPLAGHIAGYYILDDYAGNFEGDMKLYSRVADILHRVHPGCTVIQGFGCTLDYPSKNTPGEYSAAFEERKVFYTKELLNFAPDAVDGVLLYIYSLRNQPGSDYTMRNLAPFMMRELTMSGYTPDRHLIIGGPQCWEDNATPSRLEIIQQCVAFVRLFGAKAMCAFTWNQFGPPHMELATNAAMRNGYMAARERCLELWGVTNA